MILSDLVAGLMTVVVLVLYLTGRLEIWQLCVTGAIAAVFEPFQWPAFSATMTLLVPKEQYGRANGLISLAEMATGIVAPLLAGILLATTTGLGGILVIDIVTFIFAVLSVLVVFIPKPPPSEAGREGQGTLWQESIYGFKFIWTRKSLLGVQLCFTISNFFGSMAFILVTPMILLRTGNSEATVGLVQAFMGVGGVVGGLLMSIWGGPRPRIHGVLAGFILTGILGEALMGVGQALPIWLTAAFFSLFFIPFLNGSNQSIWQAKVAPDVQGRVFATRRLIAQVTGPIGMLLAGPLADKIFEPAMQVGGQAAAQWGWLVGVGPGAGMGLLLVVVGLLSATAGVVGYALPVVRQVETRMPDFEVAAEAA